MPRLAPLGDEEFAEAIGVPIPHRGHASPRNLLNTLARHALLVRPMLPFGLQLMSGALLPVDRELLILRTGFRCNSPYEWGQHVLIARDVGLSDADIERVALGPDAPGWNARERLLLVAADELHDVNRITTAVWNELAELYDERQLIEIPMLVGYYHMVAYAANALVVEGEERLPGLPTV
jgi:alkylhydroperoxidase family enzyme